MGRRRSWRHISLGAGRYCSALRFAATTDAGAHSSCCCLQLFSHLLSFCACSRLDCLACMPGTVALKRLVADATWHEAVQIAQGEGAQAADLAFVFCLSLPHLNTPGAPSSQYVGSEAPASPLLRVHEYPVPPPPYCLARHYQHVTARRRRQCVASECRQPSVLYQPRECGSTNEERNALPD